MAGREGRRKPVPRQSSFRSIAALMLIPICGFVVFVFYRFVREHVDTNPPRVNRASMVTRLRGREVTVATPQPRNPATSRKGQIVLIIDDVGFDHQPLDAAMRIDPNLNFSILPNAQHAHEFAEELHTAGFEVLCHLPMEPVDYPRQSPGKNAVMTAMSDAQIAETTREDIAAVPHAAGVNNHMGSRATSDPRVMRAVLTSLPKGMFFIDSMTTSRSVAERVAREMRIPTAARQVFLDDVQEEGAVRKQLAQLTADAEQRGMAIGIGHMYPVTVRVLSEAAPELRAKGFRFVRASEAVD
ncbi:MAG TPA: divergent polysaccharide deacetylase family protein [Thermoanaerobaculia bacterium]